VSVDGRGDARRRMLRRVGLVAAALVLLALIFLSGGHWVLGIIFAVAAVAAIWVFLQLRTVR
jgi:fatty acid desaturase